MGVLSREWLERARRSFARIATNRRKGGPNAGWKENGK
jgi:hypothetical protein